MKNVQFKETIRNRLIESVKKHYSLINKKIIISAEHFTMKKVHVQKMHKLNWKVKEKLFKVVEFDQVKGEMLIDFWMIFAFN